MFEIIVIACLLQPADVCRTLSIPLELELEEDEFYPAAPIPYYVCARMAYSSFSSWFGPNAAYKIKSFSCGIRRLDL